VGRRPPRSSPGPSVSPFVGNAMRSAPRAASSPWRTASARSSQRYPAASQPSTADLFAAPTAAGLVKVSSASQMHNLQSLLSARSASPPDCRIRTSCLRHARHLMREVRWRRGHPKPWTGSPAIPRGEIAHIDWRQAGAVNSIQGGLHKRSAARELCHIGGMAKEHLAHLHSHPQRE
jgi:hypothetical protein